MQTHTCDRRVVTDNIVLLYTLLKTVYKWEQGQLSLFILIIIPYFVNIFRYILSVKLMVVSKA